ncbi:MAG: U32 family peptidase [Erysipelotrichales bacterium]|nr:U32 family peptidase [Erysipelotrichales bacterium]
MKYIVEIYERNEIEIAKAHKADGIVLPLSFYSAHAQKCFKLEELAELVNEAGDMEVYIDGTRMYVDEDMNKLRELIELASSLHVKGIYFADMSGYQMCHELGHDELCYYQPDTMVVNSYDAAFFLQRMGGICLAKELTLDEIIKISEYNKGNVEVFLHGCPLMSMSKRPLIENYFDEIKYTGELKDLYYLKEEKRPEPFPVLRNEQGTFFFGTYIQESFKELSKLNEVNTKQGRISHMITSFDEMMDALDMYKDIEINGYDEDKVQSFKNKYSTYNYSTGFYYQKTSVKKEYGNE